MAKGDPGEVFNITNAQRALSEEQAGRTRRYLLSMGIRTACLLGAVVVSGWPRWIMVAGAVVLPYFAVVAANAGRENDDPGDVGVSEQPRPALPAKGIEVTGPDDRPYAA
jgi:Protein of unknown function (DUF3099)